MKRIKYLLELARIHHWIKNTFIFAPLIFSFNLFNPPFILKSVLVFFAFSLTASAVYMINDLSDINKDRLHPVKRRRPLARGALSSGTAVLCAGGLLTGAGVLIALLNSRTGATIGIYLILNIIYSFWLKNHVVLDVIIISLGFVLRVMAGAFAIDVSLSNWLVITTLTIALMLGFGKRRNELLQLEKDQSDQRPVLARYTPEILNFYIIISTSLTILAYTLYTIDPGVIAKLHSSRLIYSVPLVIYGIFRYLYLIYVEYRSKDDPTDILLSDRALQITVVLWISLMSLLIYLEA